MKFYVSGEPYRRLKNAFTNLNSFKIIDVDWLVENSGLNPNDSVDGYLLAVEIRKLIEDAVKCKRCTGIIYINQQLSTNLVYSLKNVIIDIMGGDVMDVILLDDYDVPKHKEIYRLFDEIVYYPTHKKTKIVEAKAILPPKET